MIQRCGLSLTELDNMMPWERDAYVSIYIQDAKKKQLIADQNRS